MSFAPNLIQRSFIALNASGDIIHEFSFPRGARILRYFAIPSVAQAAHSTVVDSIVFVNAGTDGSGTTELATLTNDSDLADSTVRESGAWVAHDVKELITNDRPGGTATTNVWDVIAAGGVIKATLTGAGSTPTANWFTIGVEYVEST